jgi:hypothetical protein
VFSESLDESDNEHENGSVFEMTTETKVARFTVNPTPSTEDISSFKPSRTPSRQNVAVLGDPNTVVNENAPNKKPEFSAINKEVLKTANRYHKKQPKGTIDVWWLFDDGGKKIKHDIIFLNFQLEENIPVNKMVTLLIH